MKIFNLLLILAFISACGIKNDPIPKSTLNIPPPLSFDYRITSNGVEITNKSEDYPLLVERAAFPKNYLSQASFKRIALINQGDTFLDTDLIKGEKYKYRLRYFYKFVGTYSNPLIQDLTFRELVKLDIAHIYELGNSVCISSQFPTLVKAVEISINGKLLEEALQSNKELCTPKPESRVVQVMLIPYDEAGNAGVAFSKSIIQDVDKNNFPPQNIRAFRSGQDIVLSWDTGAKVDSYKIYLIKSKKEQLISTQAITSFSYKAPSKECVDFMLSAVRNGKESKKKAVSACL